MVKGGEREESHMQYQKPKDRFRKNICYADGQILGQYP